MKDNNLEHRVLVYLSATYENRENNNLEDRVSYEQLSLYL